MTGAWLLTHLPSAVNMCLSLLQRDKIALTVTAYKYKGTMQHFRTFYPVGHGAFFVEKLYTDKHVPYIAVYDCGDSQNGSLVQKYALQAFSKPFEDEDEKIDLLFISHFDDDHVNGLTHLKPYLTKQTKVFLPFFYNTYIDLYNKSKREGISYVISVLDDVGIRPILIAYNGENPQDEVDLDKPLPERNYSNLDSPYPVLASGTPIKLGSSPIWKYVPYNLFNEAKLFQDFRSKIKSSSHWSDAKLNDPLTWTDDEIVELRNIYKTFSTYSINSNSLIVLSAPSKIEYMWLQSITSDFLQQGYLHHCYHHPDPVLASSLYTGDTVLKRGAGGAYKLTYEEFLYRLKKQTKRVGLMQIPHHGSSNNINKAALCDCMSCSMFCNYGTSDLSYKTFLLNCFSLSSIWKDILAVTELSKTIEISLVS